MSWESFDLTLPLSDRDTRDLRWYLEEYVRFVGAGDRVRAGKIEARIEGWGRQLFDAVSPSGAGDGCVGHGAPGAVGMGREDPP